MILEIYQSMLKTAKEGGIPDYVEMTYHIEKDQSKGFWADATLKHEHEMLLDEWEPVSKGRYKKTLYGIKFAIQFDYE
jgi:hypothetical protein